MAAVVYSSQPNGAPQLNFTEADEETSLAGFLTPQWRCDQEKMAHDAMAYQQPGFGIDPDWSLYRTDTIGTKYDPTVLTAVGGPGFPNDGPQPGASEYCTPSISQLPKLSYASIVSKPPPSPTSSTARKEDTKTANPATSRQFLQTDEYRRSSITSVNSARTDISTKPKLTFGKRIRKVFSLNSISNRYAEDDKTIHSDMSRSILVVESSETVALEPPHTTAPTSARPASVLGYSIQNNGNNEDNRDEDDDIITADAFRKDTASAIPRVIPPRSGTPQPMLRRRSLVKLGSLFSSDKQSKTEAGSAEASKRDKAKLKQEKDSLTKRRSPASDLKSSTQERQAGTKIKGPAQRKTDVSNITDPKKAKSDVSRGILKIGKNAQASSSSSSLSSAKSSITNPVKPSTAGGRIPRPISKTESSSAQSKLPTLPLAQPSGQVASQPFTEVARHPDPFSNDRSADVNPSSSHHHQIHHHRSSPNLMTNATILRPEFIRQSSSPDQRALRHIQFSQSVEFYDTHSPNEYDRRCDPNVTCAKLTPLVAMKIKQELNEYKLKEMDVHIDSRMYTHFFL